MICIIEQYYSINSDLHGKLLLTKLLYKYWQFHCITQTVVSVFYKNNSIQSYQVTFWEIDDYHLWLNQNIIGTSLYLVVYNYQKEPRGTGRQKVKGISHSYWNISQIRSLWITLVPAAFSKSESQITSKWILFIEFRKKKCYCLKLNIEYFSF